VIGFWPAASDIKDSVKLYEDEGYESKSPNWNFFVGKSKKQRASRNLLADFIRRGLKAADSTDHIGAFAVTIKGIEPHLKNFDSKHDNYNRIMLQALADRLAEALLKIAA
jgi:5-methyltetrahydrofolate--homocysteine methyltransferase